MYEAFQCDFWINRFVVNIATGIFLSFGCSGITIAVHLPLNKKIQKIEVNIACSLLADERSNFEKKWNYYNNIRTVISFSVNFILILIIFFRNLRVKYL